MKKGNKVLNTLALFFATGFYSGYFPIASGTVGAFVGLIIYWVIPDFEIWYVSLGFIIVFTVIGLLSGNIAEEKYGFDPPEVVIDEIVGMWITLFILPKTIVISIVAFLVCRVLDIVKPFPARDSQKLKGGFGIMFDDIIAGIYGLILLHILILIFPGLKSL